MDADNTCPECGDTFTRPQGLAGHRSIVHGYRNPDRTSDANRRQREKRRELAAHELAALLRLGRETLLRGAR